MDINLQEHGYPANISIPITINIALPEVSKPGASLTKPDPTPAGGPNPSVQAPETTTGPKAGEKTKGTPHSVLGIFGDSIAEFLNGEHGAALGDMIGFEREFAEPPLNEYKREEIEQAIKQIGQQVALDNSVGLLDKLLVALTRKGTKTPDGASTSPESEPADSTSGDDGAGDTQGPDGPTDKTPDSTTKFSIAGQELIDYLTKFVDDHLTEFYTHGADDSHVKSVIQKAAELAEQLPGKFNVPAELVPRLATLGLYDVFVLLDDSGSMTSDAGSIPAAKETILRLFEIATTVNPDAYNFSLVPYANDGVQDLASIKSDADLAAKFDKILFNTGQSPDGPLGLKIFSPLSIKAGKSQLARPVFVLIISDARESEGQGQLTSTRITEFMAGLKTHGYSSPQGLRMAICNVAADTTANSFISALESAAGVKDTLYIFNENMSRDKVATILSKAMGLGLE